MKYQNIVKHQINIESLNDELEFKAIHSSGKGGQNVNKVSTKIVLTFDLEKSKALNYKIKHIIFDKLKNRISKNNKIQISSSKERSQYLNKKQAINKLIGLINEALEENQIRIATFPTQKSKKKRLEEKSNVSKKSNLELSKSMNTIKKMQMEQFWKCFSN